MTETRISTGLGNYYGTVEFVERDGKHFLVLENWDGFYGVEITQRMFAAAKSCFKVPGEEKQFPFERVPA